MNGGAMSGVNQKLNVMNDWMKKEKRFGNEVPQYAYCLHCETQQCGKIAEYIRRNHGLICFSPQIIQRKWIKGYATEEAHDWLPGYVFLYSDEPITPRFDVSGIIRCLGNGELKGTDLSFAKALYQSKGILRQVSLLQEGDRCVVADPSWQGMRGTVIKMDRGRKRCCLEFEFDEVKRTIWVGYEMIRQDESSTFNPLHNSEVT